MSRNLLEVALRPVGFVHSAERGPREDFWGGVLSTIELDAGRFTPDALDGLSAFSHVEIIFYFHQVAESSVVTGIRHPRGNANWPKVGIFAQRGKNRPNRIGATVCRLLSVSGLNVKVQGLDALDGTPVLDIKPVMKEFLPEYKSVRQPKWVDALMAEYFAEDSK